MKYAVIAALFSSANAASKLTGCKAGIKGNIYTDGKCENEVTSSFNLMSHHVKFTGKCVTATATEQQKTNLKTAEENVVEAAKVTKAKLADVNNVDKLEVDNADAAAPKHVDLKSVGKVFKADYPELKKKYVAWKEAEKAMADYVKTFLVTEEHDKVVAYYTKYYSWYKRSTQMLMKAHKTVCWLKKNLKLMELRMLPQRTQSSKFLRKLPLLRLYSRNRRLMISIRRRTLMLIASVIPNAQHLPNSKWPI